MRTILTALSFAAFAVAVPVAEPHVVSGLDVILVDIGV